MTRELTLGPLLSSYDVCCLSEVWKPASAQIITAGAGEGWTAVEGSGDEGEFQVLGSGLLFMAKRFTVTRTDRLIYNDRGNRLHDPDAWSNKGVLFNAIDIGIGELELFQTHLSYGGGMPVTFGPIREPTDDERMAVWRHELDELVGFVRRNRRPENVAIVTGDFNMDGANVGHYAELRRRMDQLGLQDAWAWDVLHHRPSEGQTCRYTDEDPSGWKRNFDDVCALKEQPAANGGRLQPAVRGLAYCDDDTVVPYQNQTTQQRGVGRYDFIWVERPTRQHRYHLELSRTLRRPFPLTETTDGERYLSDHIGLEVELFPSSR